jgi:putative ABC transport system substrate-binding protein
MPGDENDPEWKNCLSALTKALADLGWNDGRNLRIDFRWLGDDTNRIRAFAQELVGLQHHHDTGDPADRCRAAGDADDPDRCELSRARRLRHRRAARPPGWNVTGFATLEASLGGKWLL